MKKIFTCIVLLFVVSGTGSVFAQTFRNKPASQTLVRSLPTKQPIMWTAVAAEQAPPKSLLRMPPASYLVYKLDVAAMKAKLWTLSSAPANGAVISLPMADGSFRDFKVWEDAMMPDALAAQYPDIKTFTAEAVNDSRVTAKLDFTLFGFHAVIFDGEKTSFTDPYDNLNDGYYVVHYKKEENRAFSQRMVCAVKSGTETHAGGEPMDLNPSKLPATDLHKLKIPKSTKKTDAPFGKMVTEEGSAEALISNGNNRRTYDLALSANSHYCQAATGFATPTIGQCFSAMTTSMNRVNGIYNRELSVQLNFVVNENLIIWPTATGSINGADPFAGAMNSNASGCIALNQTTCDTRIGSANYDIGHVFTTGAGGLASLGVICNNSFKAQGVTGSSTPVGDAFDIDYVCHEMGHQFGSNHTFNNDLDGACGGNASVLNAFEPASGATIMDYAGICSPDNVQANSNAYFSANSLEQIQPHILGSGGACATSTTSGHTPPTFTATFSATYNIPYKTPFELTSPTPLTSAVDTAITYGWYQNNLGDFGRRLNQTFVNGPIFRSYQPVYNGLRVFPRLSDVLAGVLSNAGEKAPDTARFLTFKTVVRNIFAGNGCFVIADDTVHLNVSSTGTANGFAGFRVTSQNTTGIVYTGGTSQTVTWNRVGTNAAPVNATNVDIYMSIDGGLTWPFLAGTFPNSGTASVSVPNPGVSTTAARFKVKGSGNVFFNVNSTNFTVNPGVSTAPITGTFTVCVGATTALSDVTPAGTWSSGATGIATVNVLTGVVTGIAAGTAGITYTAVSGAVSVVVTVSAIPTPASITGGNGVCIGATTTLSNTTPGGTWSSSDPGRGTVSTAGVVAGIAAGTTTISYSVTNGCGTGHATHAMTVSAPTAVSPITGTLSVCQGLTTPLANTTPLGAWSSTNTPVATINSSGLVLGVSTGTSTISYSITNASGCISASTAVVTVNSVPVATTSPSGSVTICTGGTVTIAASPATAGFTYQWQDGGIDISGSTNSTFTAAIAGNFRVRITTSAGCIGTSAVVAVTVNPSPSVVPSVSLAAVPGTNICSAAGAVTFTATPVNGGGSPFYQWYVNGATSGSGGATFAYTPTNGDVVMCELTSSLACASPATVATSLTMTVNPTVTPDVSINPTPNDTVCIGQPVTYNAVPLHGGTAPSFQWTVNGLLIATGPTYSTTPGNGDIVSCQMTSNAVCRTTTVVTSPLLTMTVQAPLTNSIAISASSSTIVAGTYVTFVAIAPNAGPAAVYQWFINGTEVPGAVLATFNTNALTNGQVVYCKVTSSLPCVLPHTVLSGGFTMTVTSGIWEATKNGSSFTLNPNPSKGTFTIMGKTAGTTDNTVNISVANVIGQHLYNSNTVVKNGTMAEHIAMPAGTPAGTYLVTVTSGSEHVIFKVIIE